MPTFDQVPSREQRATVNNRAGTQTMSDYVGVTTSTFALPAKGLIHFDSSCGHLDVRNVTCGADRVYDAGSVFDRLHRGKSAASFQRSSARKLMLERRRDTSNLMIGGTEEISQAEQHFRYSRPLSRGSDYCNFDKQVSREERLSMGYFAVGKLCSSTAPPLFVSRDVIDVKIHGPPAWRPSSASSVRRSDSADDTADIVRASRPTSAASFRETVHTHRRAESSTEGLTHRSSATVREDERNPLGAFLATKRSLSRNLTFSKAPRKTF